MQARPSLDSIAAAAQALWDVDAEEMRAATKGNWYTCRVRRAFCAVALDCGHSTDAVQFYLDEVLSYLGVRVGASKARGGQTDMVKALHGALGTTPLSPRARSAWAGA